MPADRPPENDPLRACAELLARDPGTAAERIRDYLKKDPLSADAYRLLIRAAEARGMVASGGITSRVGSDARLLQAAQAIDAGDLEAAEIILRPYLRQQPSDVTALRLLAGFAIRLDYEREAESLLGLALELEPDFDGATFDLAALHYRRNRTDEALALLQPLLAKHPSNVELMNLHAGVLARAGRMDEAAGSYEQSMRHDPDQPRAWLHYGGLLRTMDRTQDSAAAIRRAIALRPSFGEAWWSLADLKTVGFDSNDLAAMDAALNSGTIGDVDRFYIHLALGRAYEDTGKCEAAFGHYAAGNRLHRQAIDYDAGELTDFVRHAIEVFTPDLFAARGGHGSPAPDPIFIVGMPRSGSTLVEQILASHPLVEGTMELPDMLELARELGTGRDYVDAVAKLEPAARDALGGRYIDGTRRYRKSARPYFVDKMPNNWMHVPLIQLILPKARIIDVRRHPLACGWSNFKQHFLGGHPFSYDLGDIGRYYADYVAFMRHVDAVLPGRVHRLIYEDLVTSPEAEIRRLLAFLDLPFDEACLAFHATDRVVRSASAQQVRRPLNSEGMEGWKPFEPWLGPLKESLGAVLDCYPQPPSN